MSYTGQGSIRPLELFKGERVAATEEVEKGVVWGSTDLSGVSGATDSGGELREALRCLLCLEAEPPMG